MKRKTIIYFTGISIFLLGCSKSDQESINNVASPQLNASATEMSPPYYKNAKNAFDHEGQGHNDCLKNYILPSMHYWNSKTPVSDVIDVGIEYMIKHEGADETIVRSNTANAFKKIEQYMDDEKNKTLAHIAISAINDWNSTDAAKNYGIELISYLVDSVNSFNPDSVIMEVKNIEDNIITDAKITSFEKEHLLRMTSVVRHSLFFWQHHTVQKENQPSGDAPPKWWTKLKTFFTSSGGTAALCDVLVYIATQNMTGGWALGSAAVVSYTALLTL